MDELEDQFDENGDYIESEDFDDDLEDEIDNEIDDLLRMPRDMDNREVPESTWIRIKGFRKYMINKQGIVRSRKTMKVLKPRKAITKYWDIGLVGDNGKVRRPYVHSLVFFSWHPEEPRLKKGEVISHEDSNYNHNILSNLKRSSRSRNGMIHNIERRKNGKI